VAQIGQAPWFGWASGRRNLNGAGRPVDSDVVTAAAGDTAALGAAAPDCVKAGSSSPADAEAGCTRPALRAPHRSRTNGDTPSRRSLLNNVLNIGTGGAEAAAVTGAAMLGEAVGVSAAVAGAAGTVGWTGAAATAGIGGMAVPSCWANWTVR